ncbi:MAG: hypothetical protein A2284_01800 [Deltaproteobacteria bacterium RIFOXYA12_FULL_61_11]|nr:MAG: hypothetical protein A2284_01800 [Deltaproteobacteria bacterium RIFOXYA12_FULL_61_11]
MNCEMIMSRRVVKLQLDDTIKKINELFERFPFHHFPVVEGETLVGIISDRDVLQACCSVVLRNPKGEDFDPSTKKAHQIMTRNPITVTPTTGVLEAARILLKNGISCLLVMDNQKLVGILTWRDLLKDFIQTLEE